MTESGSYPIETGQDLSQYIDKQVKVTGILEHHTAARRQQAVAASVVTDIRLRMIATVIGDCNRPSK